MNSHRINKAFSIILVITICFFLFGCKKEVEKKPTEIIEKTVSNHEEFIEAIKFNELFLMKDNILVNIPLLELSNSVNIDLNGYSLQLVGNYIINNNTINIKDSKRKGTLDLTNFYFVNNDSLETGVKYEMFNLNIDESNLKFSLDSYLKDPVLKSILKSNENGVIKISYAKEDFVTKSQEEALGIEKYIDGKRDGKEYNISTPIELFNYNRELTENALFNISAEGKLVLTGGIKFTKGLITINCKELNNIDISRLRVVEISSTHDKKLFKISGIDLNSITLPPDTKIDGEYIVYAK